MAESQDVNALKRRGRRRLVGAIALVLLAAIVLPMVFDQEPKPAVPPVSLRIPSEDDAKLSVKPPVAPGAAPTGAESRAANQQNAAPAAGAGASTGTAPAASPATSTEAKSVAPPRAAQEPAVEFVVPVAALASTEKVKELVAALKAAKLPHYTEPIATAKGTVTRVRVGPFSSRQAAEDAAVRLQRLGLKPGKVLEKS